MADSKYEKTVFCDHEVRVRIADRYLSATDLAKVGGKEWKHYKENKKTATFLNTLSFAVGKSTADLVQSITKNSPDRGTWIHPRVAINFAQWINTDFAVQVTDWVERVIIKDLSLAKEIIDGHGEIKDDEEKKLAEAMERKLFIERVKYEDIIKAKNGIIKAKDDKIDDLQKQIFIMRKNQEEMIKQNKILLEATSETLREAQDANDKLDDMKENIRANAPFRAHVPANVNKREVMIISRTRDDGPIPWHYYISCIKKDGMKAARRRAKDKFPQCEEIRVIEYVPNARHMLEELDDYMGRDIYRRSARVRVLVQMTEKQFMRVVDEVHRIYIDQANEVV